MSAEGHGKDTGTVLLSFGLLPHFHQIARHSGNLSDGYSVQSFELFEKSRSCLSIVDNV